MIQRYLWLIFFHFLTLPMFSLLSQLKRVNEGVPADVKKFEAQRQESYVLQAKVLHLRNQLYRQTKIRTLNEKTCAATKERAVRVESLVAEMRADLKSLKNRLDEELEELGINHEKADEMLNAYFHTKDSNDQEVEDIESGAVKKVRTNISLYTHIACLQCDLDLTTCCHSIYTITAIPGKFVCYRRVWQLRCP